MHELASRIFKAKERGDVEEVRMLREMFRGIALQYTTSGAAKDLADFSALERVILTTDAWLRKAAGGVGRVIDEGTKRLLLFGALAVAGIALVTTRPR